MEETYIRVLSGNLAGQVLAVGRDIPSQEAEIDVTTGCAEWCAEPSKQERDGEPNQPTAGGDGGPADAIPGPGSAAEGSGGDAGAGEPGPAPAAEEPEAPAGYTVKERGGGWYDVIDAAGEPQTDSAMRRDEAETLAHDLNAEG